MIEMYTDFIIVRMTCVMLQAVAVALLPSRCQLHWKILRFPGRGLPLTLKTLALTQGAKTSRVLPQVTRVLPPSRVRPPGPAVPRATLTSPAPRLDLPLPSIPPLRPPQARQPPALDLTPLRASPHLPTQRDLRSMDRGLSGRLRGASL